VYLQHDNLCHAIRSLLVLILFNLCYTMSSQPAKEWTIIYHFGGTAFKGRAEFLRLMLEDKKIDYGLSGENLRGPKGIMDCFRGSAEAVLAGDGDVSIPNPVFFPPALWHRPPGGEEVIINQVGACVMYLGEILGYAPKSPKESALASAITMNAIDYIAEGRSCFHPVKNTMSYSDQKEEGDKSSKEFAKTRMTIWLAHFEKVAKKHGSTSPVAGGANVTYADFVLFHVLDATVAQFNNEKYEMAWDIQNIDSLKEYYQWMKSRPNLKAYWESNRAPRK
jgi:glutathione S-transferase